MAEERDVEAEEHTGPSSLSSPKFHQYPDEASRSFVAVWQDLRSDIEKIREEFLAKGYRPRVVLPGQISLLERDEEVALYVLVPDDSGNELKKALGKRTRILDAVVESGKNETLQVYVVRFTLNGQAFIVPLYYPLSLQGLVKQKSRRGLSVFLRNLEGQVIASLTVRQEEEEQVSRKK